MNYLDIYDNIRQRFNWLKNEANRQKLMDAAKGFSNASASVRNQAAGVLHTGFKQGFNGLRNTGTENSGEVERLKRKLRGDFNDTQNKLAVNEFANLYNEAIAMQPSKKTVTVKETVKDPVNDGVTSSAVGGRFNGAGPVAVTGGKPEVPTIRTEDSLGNSYTTNPVQIIDPDSVFGKMAKGELPKEDPANSFVKEADKKKTKTTTAKASTKGATLN